MENKQMLWQLKKLSTNENLNEPRSLPENWGPIFGMEGVKDKLGDLSWLGDPEFTDTGWVEVPGDAPAGATPSTPAELQWKKAKSLLLDSDWSMLPDVPLTAGEKVLWEAYRKALREIKLQPDFPTNINWPTKPV